MNFKFLTCGSSLISSLDKFKFLQKFKAINIIAKKQNCGAKQIIAKEQYCGAKKIIAMKLILWISRPKKLRLVFQIFDQPRESVCRLYIIQL
jgi:hypothetical protein